MGKLDGKVAIVIGSTSGIGQAIAERYAAEGAKVVVTGRRAERGEAIVDGIKKAGGEACFMQHDSQDIEATCAVIDNTVAKYGRLDILEYNSGFGKLDSLEEILFGNITERLWDAVFNVNLKAAFFVTQKAMPELIKTKGTVIYTSSNGGISAKNVADSLVYGVTKAAMSFMMKIVAVNVADKGVRVNALAPGLIETDILAGTDPKYLELLKTYVPMKNIGNVKNVADAALFLASDDAAFITGHALVIDGGMSIG